MSEKLKSSSDDIGPILQDHGAGAGVRMNPVDAYNGPIRHVSDAEAVQRDHGAGAGVPGDPMEKMGTRDEDLLNIVNKLRHATWSEGLQEEVNSLPAESISELISQRYKQSANALDDKYSDIEALGRRMYFDLSIIAAAVDTGKDLPDIETSQYMGTEDKRNLEGVLDGYADKIKESGRKIELIDSSPNNKSEPLDALETIQTIKENIEAEKAD